MSEKKQQKSTDQTSSPYLIPLAIIVAGGLVGAGIYFGGRREKPGVQQEEVAGEQVGEDSSAFFEKYAADLGLNAADFNACLNSGKFEEEVEKDLADGQAVGVSGTPTFFVGRGGVVAYDKAPTQDDPFFYLGNTKVGLIGAQPFESFEEVIEGVLASSAVVGETATKISLDDDAAKGPSDAEITVIEFSEYQCPYCKRYVDDAYQKVFEKYGDRVRYIFRDFPLIMMHPNALGAAVAAECAGEQGKYYEYHDLLFKRTTEWAE